MEAEQISIRVFESVMDSLGLTPRPQQQALVGLARDIVASSGQTGFVQAGTGVGKSFAALSVALEAKRVTKLPSVVICPTNRLIDQYIEQDAPRVAKATGADIQYLKGRRNYLCSESYGFETEFGRDALKKFTEMVKDGRLEWAQHYGLDDSYGCDGNCDNQAATCAVQLARQRAATADVIVTNGHMLVFDRLVQEWSNFEARLLPDFGALFIDECHELDEVTQNCLSDSIGPNAEIYKQVPDLMRWVMSLITEAGLSESGDREVAVDPADPKLAEMARNADRQRARLVARLENAEAKGDKAVRKNLKKEIRALERLIEFAAPYDETSRFISSVSVEPDQMFPGGLKPSLNRLCLDSAPTTRPILQGQPSVLISGTVPPSLPSRLGVTGAPLSDVGTPFDYSRSELAVSDFDHRLRSDLPKRLSELKGAILDKMKPHSEGGGGTLVLVTSWSDLDMIANYLAHSLPASVPVLTQARNDAADTAEMLERFADHGHAVLIGVRTMWTGVDIPGPALRQVAIWKIPYPVPDIKVRAIQERRGSRDIYNDSMMQLLTQGIGRLVRTTSDDGRVLICDSRAKSRNWSANPMSRHIASFARRGR